MPRKSGAPKTVQFSITLPVEATDKMKKLAKTGFFSPSRGEIARELILAQLRELGAPAIADALKITRKRKKRR
jgi:hypothetical protein